MTPELKSFLENNIHLIETNQFNALYAEVLLYANTEELTSVLYAADVDPLEYLAYVPSKFAYKITNVESYVIPEGIEWFGKSAFAKNALRKITIPSTVNRIGENCFSFCDNLKFIDTADVNEIEDSAFLACYNLESVTTNAEVIRTFAFKDCMHLKNVKLLQNVKTIESWVFNHCPLTEIHYEGTKAEWQNIELEGKWNDGNIHTILCSDGKIII